MGAALTPVGPATMASTWVPSDSLAFTGTATTPKAATLLRGHARHAPWAEAAAPASPSSTTWRFEQARTVAAGLATASLVAAGGRRRRAPATGPRSRRRAVEVPQLETSISALDEKVLEYATGLYKNVLGKNVPYNLEVFLKVAQGSGWTLLKKDEWRSVVGDLHPFIVPFGYRGDPTDEDVEVIGVIIRTPNGQNLQPEEYQVVSQKPRKSLYVKLMATDMQKYIMKRAEEATFRKEKEDLSVIEATRDAYEVRFKGSDRTALDKWLLLEVGAFPDVYQHLAEEFIEGGDVKSGLVIAETMRDAFGTTWCFPHAYCCRTLRTMTQKTDSDRTEEADHCAQRCFTAGYPLWTLEEDGDSLEDLVNEAKMERLGNLESLRVYYIRRSTDDQRVAVRTGSISLGCAAVAKAQAIMDAVCCGYKSYDGVRQELFEIYEEVPGCEPLCDLILHFKL